MGGGAEIGADCTIFHEVTLGRGTLPGEPRIGDHVVLFVGTRVLAASSSASARSRRELRDHPKRAALFIGRHHQPRDAADFDAHVGRGPPIEVTPAG